MGRFANLFQSLFFRNPEKLGVCLTKRGVKLALKLLGRRVRAVFNLALGRGLSQEIFDLLYTVKEDPWQYRTSVLERGKIHRFTHRFAPASLASGFGGWLFRGSIYSDSNT